MRDNASPKAKVDLGNGDDQAVLSQLGSLNGIFTLYATDKGELRALHKMC